ncbi:GDP-L-galactose phosphorylase [Marchantia polymorpha subsp. ruderalis]|uniref:GDP-D-glucose phosphorylase 1 n=2 Tax=Marchantia polymorpha TaxID=3197 RepID=A0A176VYE5_MARPO|nr:hypothetical protein AXG93_4620s2060 [Marchantia polymorpha subsp. ruderalis]PTQ41014.1 hypothetical protein MARPO_0036s0021 [Marchantia polymorpha]BBM97710.1 hypothetical protein Mp_1g07760 [Marchantia polymorpha subsp. ruderalis]|eukprot:PTQ41014.1 hypothetical protein MARPO_0036s0021 [Marchantia polymorpha]
MLTIRRVSTVVSINQVSGAADSSSLGASLPLYCYGRRDTTKVVTNVSENALSLDSNSASNNQPVEDASFLDSLLLSQWEDRMEKGLFRYDVTACETKVLPGVCGFIAQLNEGRHLKKRPTEFRVDQVLQPYDAKKFNFTKVDQQEILFAFDESSDHCSEYSEQAFVGESPNVVAINVSPIEYGHVLLVPQVKSQIPQRICPETFLLALHMTVEVNNPYFRLGYNSLGAFATINHLHFQAYYLHVPFPIERAETSRLYQTRKKGGCKISQLVNYPVRTIVYDVGESLEEFADIIANACIRLQNDNIPFNVLIADCGARVFLIPQCYAERQARGEVDQAVLDTQVNPAVWEISGHIVLKRREDFDIATEDYAKKLLAEVTLSEDRFTEVKKMCIDAAEDEKLDNCEVMRSNDDPYRGASVKAKNYKFAAKFQNLYDECAV